MKNQNKARIKPGWWCRWWGRVGGGGRAAADGQGNQQTGQKVNQNENNSQKLFCRNYLILKFQSFLPESLWVSKDVILGKSDRVLHQLFTPRKPTFDERKGKETCDCKKTKHKIIIKNINGTCPSRGSAYDVCPGSDPKETSNISRSTQKVRLSLNPARRFFLLDRSYQIKF